MSPVTFLTKIRDFAKVRSSRIGSSLFKYLKNSLWCKMGVTGLHDSHARVLALIIVLL